MSVIILSIGKEAAQDIFSFVDYIHDIYNKPDISFERMVARYMEDNEITESLYKVLLLSCPEEMNCFGKEAIANYADKHEKNHVAVERIVKTEDHKKKIYPALIVGFENNKYSAIVRLFETRDVRSKDNARGMLMFECLRVSMEKEESL